MTPQKSRDHLDELRRAIEGWRRARKPSAAMPKELWSTAVRIATKIGVGVTAKTLKLDHGKLKRLTEGEAFTRKPKVLRPRLPQGGTGDPEFATFVELSAATIAKSFSPASLTCLLEIESSRQARMRVQLNNATALDLAAILREFSR